MDTASQVLRVFLESPEENISGQYISERLSVSRNSVWKGIEQLRKCGYTIEGITNKGYIITDYPTSIDKYYLQAMLKPFWKDIIVVDSTDSTNMQLKKLGDLGQSEGSIYIAKEQTKGKGRLGRQWSSQSGGLWMSILLRPQLPMEDLSLLTLTMAAMVREGIKDHLGIEAQIKWPNDILYKGKKIAGILTEVKGDMDSVDYVVVGIGINCNNKVAEELADKATSLATISQVKVNMNNLLIAITEKLEYYYQRFMQRDFKEILDINRKYSFIIGKEIEINSVKGTEEGKVVDISEEGCLIIRQRNNIMKVVSGDVSLSNTYTKPC